MGEGQLKQDIGTFLKNNALWIALAIAAIILITLIVILLVYKFKKKPDQIESSSSSDWINALGGADNVLEVNAVGSRLTLKLLDSSKLDEEKIKSLGVTNIIKMSNKITLVVEDKADKILAKIK